MALGIPAIPTPNQLELRAVQGAISNARQRIEALEGAVNVNASIASASATAGSGQVSVLRALLDALAVRVAALEGGGGTGGHDDSSTQIATQSFMPHVSLVQAPLPQEAATILATKIFGP